MARSRNVKPGLFLNEVLAGMPHWVRLLFVGLWTVADRSGRLEDNARRIGAALFPYESGLSINDGLTMLDATGFIKRYSVDGACYIQILAWDKHQNPHPREAKSTIPPFNCRTSREITRPDQTFTGPGNALPRKGMDEPFNYTAEQCLYTAFDNSNADNDLSCGNLITRPGNAFSRLGNEITRPVPENTGRAVLIPDSLLSDSLLSDSSNSKSPSDSEESESETSNVVPMPSQKEDPVLSWFEESFWPLWPRREGKQHAIKAARAQLKTQELRALALEGLRRQLPELQSRQAKYIPLPATWINGRRWEDETRQSGEAEEGSDSAIEEALADVMAYQANRKRG